MFEIRPYIPNDYFEIERRKFDLLSFLNMPDPKTVSRKLACGEAYTILLDGKVMASGGILPLWKGVGEAWAITSDMVESHKLFFGKTALKVFKKALNGFERVQTLIDADHAVSMKWAERLGFVNEGLMRKFIGGRDYYRYALIRGC